MCENYAIVKFYWFVILYNFYPWILKFMTKIPLKFLLSLKLDMTIPSWNLMTKWHNLSWTFSCLQLDRVIIHDISPQLKHCLLPISLPNDRKITQAQRYFFTYNLSLISGFLEIHLFADHLYFNFLNNIEKKIILFYWENDETKSWITSHKFYRGCFSISTTFDGIIRWLSDIQYFTTWVIELYQYSLRHIGTL